MRTVLTTVDTATKWPWISCQMDAGPVSASGEGFAPAGGTVLILTGQGADSEERDGGGGGSRTRVRDRPKCGDYARI
jgi:hypothetical protein